MAPTDRPAGAAGDFFIADRLRGIPLVSMSKSWQESSSTTTTTTTTTTSKPTTSEVPKMLNRASQVGKRDASSMSFTDTHGRRIQSQAEILFKQTRSTSSVAQLVKSTTRRPQRITTTTTGRPPVIRTTTTRRATTSTTRRPKTTTTTTTRRQQHGLAKMIRANSDQHQVVGTTTVKPNETNVSAIDRLNEPISSLKMSTLAAMSGTVGSTLLASTLPLLSTTSTPASITTTGQSLAAITTPIVSAITSSREKDAQRFNQQHYSTTLMRSMQTLTTLPVNQRRTQPNLVPVRGGSGSTSFAGSGSGRFAANDPRNGYAGENWYLFKRSDGDLSAFEILVLLANIMIVVTIILVILINWIRVFKKKRAPPPAATVTAAAGHQVAGTGPLSTAEVGSDRASKMSLISSGGTSQITSMTTSAPDAQTTTTVTTTTTSNQQQPIASSGQQQQQQQQVAQAKASEIVLDKAKEEAEKLGQNLVGASQRIASEFSSARANVANKAMAIVQPTENTSSSRTQANENSTGDNFKKNLKDELLGGEGGAPLRTISRSVSDLSAGGGHATDRVALEKKSADDTTTPDRVTALEELFSGTKREIEMQKDEEATRRMKMKRMQQGPKGERPVHSASSLESIDLPNNLVESIKRTAPSTLRAQVDETLTPSPNLLLGEVDVASKKPAAIATADTKTTLKDKQATEQATTIKAELHTSGGPRQSKTKDEDQSSADRPQNPMSRAMGDVSEKEQVPVDKLDANKSGKPPPPAAQLTQEVPNKRPQAGKAPVKQGPQETTTKTSQEQPQPPVTSMEKPPTAEVKNHQVVVNKLDKRKTNLEIVDLRDESVTGKMRANKDGKEQTDSAADNSTSWISMDGVAVVQPSTSAAGATAVPMSPAAALALQQQQQAGAQAAIASSMSPSEIIDSRFRVDYKSKRKGGEKQQQQDSVDSKQEEYVFNNIENELELDNKMKNRKYFVYIVHDGHFTAKKECIARIELPPKRRITLAELRQLISSSQDISLSSLRRNRFKFVTETYRLLNENEDAAVLHQVYPTQGVFLKLNVNETENQSYAFKGGRSTRLSSGAGTTSAGGGGGGGGGVAGSSSLSQTTIASRRRAANVRAGAARRAGGGDGAGGLPAIEVNQYGQSSGYGQSRASSVAGQRGRGRVAGPGGGAYARSKSSVQTGRSGRVTAGMRRGVSTSNININDDDNGGLNSLGMSHSSDAGGRSRPETSNKRGRGGASSSMRPRAEPSKSQLIGEAASDLGANMVAGAKKLFSSTFHR